MKLSMKTKLVCALRDRFIRLLSLASVAGLAGVCAADERDASQAALREALTFHASFDRGPDADFGHGDRRLHFAPSMKHPRLGRPGLPPGGHVSVVKDAGRFGDALRFHNKAPEMVYFQAEKNFVYRTNEWSGTVSLWLKTDPGKELAPGFCDPVQITPREWNDAAFFVEFEKRTNSIPFRLGVYADFKVWNPQNRDWNSIRFEEKPLVAVEQPPFAGDQWTHVVFTFERFNTGRKDGLAKLYLNGELRGTLSPREKTFTWEPSKTLVMLGLNYVGLFDDLAIFNRALSDREVRGLYALSSGARALHE
jgi:Concanavalin A-like lectin/glucanases superfamily